MINKESMSCKACTYVASPPPAPPPPTPIVLLCVGWSWSCAMKGTTEILPPSPQLSIVPPFGRRSAYILPILSKLFHPHPVPFVSQALTKLFHSFCRNWLTGLWPKEPEILILLPWVKILQSYQLQWWGLQFTLISSVFGQSLKLFVKTAEFTTSGCVHVRVHACVCAHLHAEGQQWSFAERAFWWISG